MFSSAGMSILMLKGSIKRLNPTYFIVKERSYTWYGNGLKSCECVLHKKPCMACDYLQRIIIKIP